MTMSYRVRYRTLGGHVHAHFWSSEFGPETTHGGNGRLIFRVGEDWEKFKSILEAGAAARDRVIKFELIDETEVGEDVLCRRPVPDIIGDRQDETEFDY